MGDSAVPAAIVPILSRHPRRKASIPATVRKLASRLDGQAKDKTNSPANTSRFRTEDIDPETAAANHEFRQLYQQAQGAIEAGDFPAALNHLNVLMVDAASGRLAQCHSLRGYLYLKTLEFERAEADCGAAIQLNPSDRQTYAWRAAARGEQNKWRLAFDDLQLACDLAGPSCDQYRSLKDSYLETATEYFRETISGGQQTAKIFFERGWMYRHVGNAQKAERDFRQALSLDSQHAWASAGLALVQADAAKRGERLEPAEITRLYQRAFEGDAGCRQVGFAVQARLFHQQGALKEAAKVLDRLQDLAGSDPTPMFACARLRQELSDPWGAIGLLGPILDQHPQYLPAWRLRGDCFREIADDTRAIADYSEFLAGSPTDAGVLLRRARSEFRKGNVELAIDDLDQALTLDKTLLEAWLLRSRIAIASGQLDLALTDCQRAIRLDNQQAEGYAVLGEIYHHLGDFSRSAEEYSRSVEYAASGKDQARYLYHRGIEWYQIGDFESAHEDFSRSLDLRPDHAGTLVWRAATCSRQDDFSGAISDLQHATNIRPTSAGQYSQLGRPIAKKAIEFYKRQQQRGNKQADVFRNRGRAYQFLGKDVYAIRDFSAALKRDAVNVESRLCRGQIYSQAGNHVAACRDFDRVIAGHPNNDLAWYCRAQDHLRSESFSAASNDIGRALKLAPRRARYHALASAIAAATGDVDAQAAALDHAIFHDPSDPGNYSQRARNHEAAGERGLAIQDLTRSLQMDASQVDVLCQRGRLWLAENEAQLAEKDYASALNFDSLSTAAQAGRANAFAKQGRHQAALISLTKAMHRFPEAYALAKIVMTRAELFRQMGRLAPAIADYSSAIDLLVDHPDDQSRALYSRAVACAQLDETDQSLADFESLVRKQSGDAGAIESALAWLKKRAKARPDFLQPPSQMVRPTRPPVISDSAADWLPKSSFVSLPPHDQWIVRLGPQKEYGPVRYDILLCWLREGRVAADSKLVRSDWKGWKLAGTLFPDAFSRSQGSVFETLPKIKEASHDG